MVMDSLRTYTSLASGLADMPRERVAALARAVLDSGNQAAGAALPMARQVQDLTEALLATSRTNRDALVRLVRSEAAGAVSALEQRVAELEEQVSALAGQVPVPHLPGLPTRSASAAGVPAAAAPAPTAATRPATKPATRPATKPATKPAGTAPTAAGTKPATKPATRPATKPATKPAGTAPTAATKPASAAAPEPATRPATKPATKRATRPATKTATKRAASQPGPGAAAE